MRPSHVAFLAGTHQDAPERLGQQVAVQSGPSIWSAFGPARGACALSTQSDRRRIRGEPFHKTLIISYKVRI